MKESSLSLTQNESDNQLEIVFGIKKKYLILAATFFPHLDWLQNISNQIYQFSTEDQQNLIFRINWETRSIRISSSSNLIDTINLDSDNQINEFISFCRSIHKIQSSLDREMDENQQIIILVDQFLISEELENQLFTLKSSLPLHKKELSSLLSLIRALNYFLPFSERINIVPIMYEIALLETPLIQIQILTEDYLLAFDKATQHKKSFINNNAPEDTSIRYKVLLMFADFMAFKLSSKSSQTVVMDDEEFILRTLASVNIEKWFFLLQDDSFLLNWLESCLQWRSIRESYELNYSFYYHDGIAIFFSFNGTLEPRIINFLPERQDIARTWIFFKNLKIIVEEYPQVFKSLAAISKDQINSNIQKLFSLVLFSSEFDISLAQELVNELHLLDSSTKKNKELYSSELSLQYYEPKKYIISQKDVFKVKFLIGVFSLITNTESKPSTQDKFNHIDGDIQVIVQIENGITEVIFSCQGDVIEILTQKDPLPGIFDAMEVILVFPPEALEIYWQTLIVTKELSPTLYEKLKFTLGCILVGTQKLSLFTSINEIIKTWETQAPELLQNLISTGYQNDRLISVPLDLDELYSEKKGPRDQLEYLYQLLSVPSDLEEDFTLIHVNESSPTNFQSFWNQPQVTIYLSKQTLEVCGYVMADNLGNLILNSLKQPFPIKCGNLTINPAGNGILEISSSNQETIHYLNQLNDSIFISQDTALILRKAIEILTIAKSIKLDNGLLPELEQILNTLIVTKKLEKHIISEIQSINESFLNFLIFHLMEKWGESWLNHKYGIDAIISFAAAKINPSFDCQFKVIHLTNFAEKFPVIINSLLLNITNTSLCEKWYILNDFQKQIANVGNPNAACHYFMDNLIIWDQGHLSIIELEENPLVKLFKQIKYYAEVCPDFIEAILVLKQLPQLNEAKIEFYMNMFLNREVKKDNSELIQLMDIYHDYIDNQNKYNCN